jgi:aspartyl-tRNA(Asn)/glutamyl-tRNA(Gln) amidotransferase subunit A
VLVTPATAGAAPMLADQRPDEGFMQPFITTVANVAALPSMVVCGGFTQQRKGGDGKHGGGLPLGLEIIGPAWGDATVLRVGHHFERASGTRNLRPSL